MSRYQGNARAREAMRTARSLANSARYARNEFARNLLLDRARAWVSTARNSVRGRV